jgi:hypothetical protein
MTSGENEYVVNGCHQCKLPTSRVMINPIKNSLTLRKPSGSDSNLSESSTATESRFTSASQSEFTSRSDRKEPVELRT